MTNHINDSVTTSAVYVLAGMTLGVALGMLLAPSSGREARQYIRGRVHDFKKSAQNVGRIRRRTDRLEVADS